MGADHVGVLAQNGTRQEWFFLFRFSFRIEPISVQIYIGKRNIRILPERAEHWSCSTKYKRIKTHFSFTSIDYGQSHQPRLAVEAPHTWKRWSTDWALGAVWSCSELLCQRTASLLLGILAFWSKWYAHDRSTFWCGRCGWGSDQWWVEQLDHGSIRWPVNLKLWGHGAKSEDLAPSFATDDLKRPGNKMLEC